MKTKFNPLPTLTTDRLVLRPLLISDAPEILLHRSDERMRLFIEPVTTKTLADAESFLEMIRANEEEGSSVTWGICKKGENKIIGSICLWNLDPENGIAELGYSIYWENWGKGYMTEAAEAVIEFGFNAMGVYIIQAFSQIENIASVKMLQRFGFVQTGVDGKYTIFAKCQTPKDAIQLETERLFMREATIADAPFFLELLNTPDWLANIGDRGVRNMEDAHRFVIHRIFLNCRKNGFGSYLIEQKSDGTCIGFCGLYKRDFLEDFDIGYAFLPPYYGKGYATEAAQAVLNLAKNKIGLERLKAFCTEKNKPSQRVLEKIGLRFERNFIAPGDEEELMLWGVKF